jgi:hypothetical protein
MRFISSHPIALFYAWAISLGLSLTEVELVLQIIGLASGIIVAILTAISKALEIAKQWDNKEDRDRAEALEENEEFSVR